MPVRCWCPVVSVEATGRNKIPRAVAEALAAKLGLETAVDIVQANRPRRTGLDALSRLFAVPEFDGSVQPGQTYLLVDDTLTQGATFAALGIHFEQGGARVAGAFALTGKLHSAKLDLSPETLQRLRDKHGDLESDFQVATGYGFDGLTQSEGQYFLNFEPSDALRDRIVEEGRLGRTRANQGATGSLSRTGDVPGIPGITLTQFNTQMAQAFGKATARRLSEAGVVVPLEDQTKLPAHVVPDVGGRGTAPSLLRNSVLCVVVPGWVRAQSKVYRWHVASAAWVARRR